MKLMNLYFISLCFSSSINLIIKPEFLEISDCSGTATTGTTISKVIDSITSTSKTRLANTKNIAKILVLETDTASDSKNDFCRKDESTGEQEYFEVKSNKIKSILYKVGNEYKLLIVGSGITNDIKPYMIDPKESNNKIVVVDYIKCLPITGLATFKGKFTNGKRKPFIEDETSLCFIHDLMTEPIEVKNNQVDAAYTITVSPFTYPACPQCQEVKDPKSCKSI